MNFIKDKNKGQITSLGMLLFIHVSVDVPLFFAPRCKIFGISPS